MTTSFGIYFFNIFLIFFCASSIPAIPNQGMDRHNDIHRLGNPRVMLDLVVTCGFWREQSCEGNKNSILNVGLISGYRRWTFDSWNAVRNTPDIERFDTSTQLDPYRQAALGIHLNIVPGSYSCSLTCSKTHCRDTPLSRSFWNVNFGLFSPPFPPGQHIPQGVWWLKF